jgi:hypothetical protein
MKICVKLLQTNDTGENDASEKELKLQNFEISFEYSDPRTSQTNAHVEKKFQTLYGRIFAMLNDACIDGEFRKRLWPECTSTATFYENIIINKQKNKTG